MWWLLFIDLRDRYGITQLHIAPTHHQLFLDATALKGEYVIRVTWVVALRPLWQENSNRSTGDIELIVDSMDVLSSSDVLPFSIEDDPHTSDENRYLHRYLDLRRTRVLQTMIFRSTMTHFTRNWFVDHDFLDVQTPLFTVSSPEWARDYLIPSRIQPGKYYALPQSPQQYKQLLMVGGIDKYFQIAPCFRDEDPRADRHSCEFYQVDAELSFVHQEDIWAIAEDYIRDLCATLVPHKTLIQEFPKIPYQTAIQQYGSDKPDIRFDCRFYDCTDLDGIEQCPFFAEARQQGWSIQCFALPNHALSRKEADTLTDIARQAWASGLWYLVITNQEVKWSLAKFFDAPIINRFHDLVGPSLVHSSDHPSPHFTLIFLSGSHDTVFTQLGKVRLACRDMFTLADPHSLAFCRVTNFPFYEQTHDGWRDFCHNPFSMIDGGHDALDQQPLNEILSQQYDMVCNGYEILSGSIRNHDPELLIKAFTKIWRDPAEIKQKFWAMYTAFRYGPPPHGWFAFGFDRLLMILSDETNIREIYAFPKSGKAEDIMMWAPSSVDPAQLKELGL
jgi:aspartyl-tRNA synthetase